MRVILNGLAGLALLAVLPHPLVAQDSVAAARRVAATAQLAAAEYRLGVFGGRVIAAPEVEEARLFLAEAERTAASLPRGHAAQFTAKIRAIVALVERTAPPDSVANAVDRMLDSLSAMLQVTLDEVPNAAPSVARGAEVFAQSCAACHGSLGRGDGPAGKGLHPPPANLAGAAALAASTPLDFYRRITIGVAGTAMPGYEKTLSPADRWAVAAYASILRLPSAHGTVPAALALFPSTARMSDSAVAAALGAGADPGRVAAVRLAQAGTAAARGRDFGLVFVEVRRLLDSAYAMAEAGRGESARLAAMDAYIAFEQVERDLSVKDSRLVTRIEGTFAAVRERADTKPSAAELAVIREELARALDQAEQQLGATLTPVSLFTQSFLILFREGLEAILVVGALMAFLVKAGAHERRREIHLGVVAAIVLSLLTAVALQTVLTVSPAHQEAMEGVTLAVATVMLFYVSYWLLSKMEVAKWNHFVKGRMASALTRRSAFALAAVAFLAVYREGFETVFFYQALALSGGSGAAWPPILAGIAVGGVVLGVVYVAINRWGVRLPLRPFFAATSLFLYVMAFVFAGKAVAELQEGGLVSLTSVSGGPRVPSVGIYPTVESLGAQLILVLLALLALVWTFVIQPRRLAPASRPVSVPRDVAARRSAAPPPSTPGDKALLKSIDRIEADLAEVRAELERMRDTVQDKEGSPTVRRRSGE